MSARIVDVVTDLAELIQASPQDPSIARLMQEHLAGFDAGRRQGFIEGRLAGYVAAYNEGHTDGRRQGWIEAGEDERRRFELPVTAGPSHAELQGKRTTYPPAIPVKTPAACLATWGNP